MDKIWCLFSIENEYSQPPANLKRWWKKKPPFEVVLKAVGGNLDREEAIIAAANVIQGKEVRLDDTDYRLEQVSEGEEIG